MARSTMLIQDTHLVELVSHSCHVVFQHEMSFDLLFENQEESDALDEKAEMNCVLSLLGNPWPA